MQAFAGGASDATSGAQTTSGVATCRGDGVAVEKLSGKNTCAGYDGDRVCPCQEILI